MIEEQNKQSAEQCDLKTDIQEATVQNLSNKFIIESSADSIEAGNTPQGDKYIHPYEHDPEQGAVTSIFGVNFSFHFFPENI